mgnify:CR=1 FL=1
MSSSTQSQAHVRAAKAARGVDWDAQVPLLVRVAAVVLQGFETRATHEAVMEEVVKMKTSGAGSASIIDKLFPPPC